jgi:activator of 2-hydroxyglutaryl-CoA dehydratase
MEIMAELVNVKLEELGALSLQSKDDGVTISSTCVVFARSEVLSYLRGGVDKCDVLAGACAALTDRVYALLKRVGVQEDFIISGGIAKNTGVVKRLENKLNLKAKICFEPQIVGALGAALFARDLLEKRARTEEGSH